VSPAKIQSVYQSSSWHKHFADLLLLWRRLTSQEPYKRRIASVLMWPTRLPILMDGTNARRSPRGLLLGRVPARRRCHATGNAARRPSLCSNRGRRRGHLVPAASSDTRHTMHTMHACKPAHRSNPRMVADTVQRPDGHGNGPVWLEYLFPDRRQDNLTSRSD
jgi:hypothetical protein